jgi:oligopeptide transport system permease protein
MNTQGGIAMGRYLLQRLGASALTLFVVVTLTFFLMRAIPGGPFTDEKNIPPQVLTKVLERYHMNDPISTQYWNYIKHLLLLDLGPSFRYEGRTVNQIIAESFPVSALVGGLALLMALGVGIPTGIISALKRGKWQDNVAMAIATVGVTIPSYVVATLFVYVFALKFGLVTVGFWEGFSTAILPAITLAGYPLAFISRLTRSSMLEVIQQDYIRTARSKGLRERTVIYIHALRNALIPIMTYLGPLAAGVLTGSFVVEQIFGVPGLGTFFVTSIQNRDYTTIMGITVFYSALLVGFNLLVDLGYALVDPRIKLD